MITTNEYKKRRQRLAEQLPANAIAILAAGSDKLRNGDAHYPFRQASNFYYLTGFQEPDALLCILAGKDGESILFNQPREPLMEQWTGKRLGQEAAMEVLGVKQAYPIIDIEKRLPELMANCASIYYPFGEDQHLEKEVLAIIQRLKQQHGRNRPKTEALCDLGPLIHEMRLFKSEAEIGLMHKAADISVQAHLRAMQKVRTSAWEYEVEAELHHCTIGGGARHMAYESIVAAGDNACILHYTANNAPLKKGDLLLIDAGAEFANYAADITRTFPINGRFSPSQAQLYNLVLRAQKAGIACIKPGVPFSLIQETILKIITAGLCDLGILKGNLESLIETQAYKPFYMHNSGHWLGLDVHDCGAYHNPDNSSRLLEAGMVLTVEPGLYMPENASVPKEFQNIGIRIEDDILVTSQGHENLTGALPVDIEAVEARLCD